MERKPFNCKDEELLPQGKSQILRVYRHLAPSEIKQIGALQDKSDF